MFLTLLGFPGLGFLICKGGLNLPHRHTSPPAPPPSGGLGIIKFLEHLALVPDTWSALNKQQGRRFLSRYRRKEADCTPPCGRLYPCGVGVGVSERETLGCPQPVEQRGEGAGPPTPVLLLPDWSGSSWDPAGTKVGFPLGGRTAEPGLWSWRPSRDALGRAARGGAAASGWAGGGGTGKEQRSPRGFSPTKSAGLSARDLPNSSGRLEHEGGPGSWVSEVFLCVRPQLQVRADSPGRAFSALTSNRNL